MTKLRLLTVIDAFVAPRANLGLMSQPARAWVFVRASFPACLLASRAVAARGLDSKVSRNRNGSSVALVVTDGFGGVVIVVLVVAVVFVACVLASQAWRCAEKALDRTDDFAGTPVYLMDIVRGQLLFNSIYALHAAVEELHRYEGVVVLSLIHI